MPSPNNVLTADSYIQDGLVFQLDGIDYGGRADGWLDRKQNIFFQSVLGGNLHVDNHFQFEKDSDYLEAETIYPAYNFIEIAIKSLVGYGSIILLNKWQGVTIATNNRVVYKPDQIYGSRNGLIARSGDSLIQNGIKIRQRTAGVSTSYLEKACIGALRVNNKNYSIAGSIYAIRVYSRQLSDREILINQKIDNARFGLGLDIPDDVLPASLSLSLLEPFELPDESESELEPTNDNSDER